MAAHGLDPEDWTYDNPVVSWWGDPARPQGQLKLFLRRKKPLNFVFPARPAADYQAPKRKRRVSKAPQLWLVLGDEQAPYHDVDMHHAILDMIETERPYGKVGTGDLVDLPDISRHRDNPEWHTPVQIGLDTGYSLLMDERRACEDMLMYQMPGNHCLRIRNEVLNRAERLYGIRRAEIPGVESSEYSVLDIPYLLRLDELGIEWVDPEGDYEHAQFKLGPHVAVRHGLNTGKNAALKSVDRLTHSLIVGHTHAQSHQKKVIYDVDRNRRTISAVETGTRTKIDGGLGFAVDPNWVNGGVAVTLWDDGSHNIDLLEWNGSYLQWGSKRYSA
jgi:hypothetical protein